MPLVSSSTTSQPTLCRVCAYSAPRIAQAGHKEIECRSMLAPTKEAQLALGLLLFAAASLCGLALGRSLALLALLAFRSLLALGQLALFELLALDLFGLGLDEDVGMVTVASTVSSGRRGT